MSDTLTEAERERIALDDTRDGMLFRFWVRAASYPGGYPGDLMQALVHCRSGSIVPAHVDTPGRARPSGTSPHANGPLSNLMMTATRN